MSQQVPTRRWTHENLYHSTRYSFDTHDLRVCFEEILSLLEQGDDSMDIIVLPEYSDALDSNHFVGCLDIGHAFLVGESPSDFIRNMGNKRLRALHIHDVDGFLDSHTLPFQGAVNWERTVKALADIEYQGDLTYEANVFLTRTPFELYSSALRHMVETGRYLIQKFQDYSN